MTKQNKIQLKLANNKIAEHIVVGMGVTTKQQDNNRAEQLAGAKNSW